MKRALIKTYFIYFFLVGSALVLSNKLIAQCVDEGNYWNKSWRSCNKTANPNAVRGISHWLLYEFDEPQNITESYVWNANLPTTSNDGANEVVIDYSIDGKGWTALGNFNFPKANENEAYEGFVGPNFEGIFIKKILITILSTHGNNTCASIAEMQFKVNQNACYGVLDECGICDGDGKTTWYFDADGDGLGTPNKQVLSCTAPNGYVANNNDYCDNGLLGWNEVYTIFSVNGCLACHGDSRLGGLQLITYQNFLEGGNKCGESIANGTTLTNIINIDSYNECGTAIGLPSMNERVQGNIDANEIALLQQWIDAGTPEDCNCLAGATDSDFDGTCDYIDKCTNFDNNLIGTTCDDFDACTENDIWIAECDCMGALKTDTDQDGVCDDLDVSPLNACTADGIIDGVEPKKWITRLTNDCDNDKVYASDDINDYDACINNSGSANTTACNCPTTYLTAGGKLKTSFDLGADYRAEGLPDGNFTYGIYSNKSITLTYPYMPAGEEICFTVGFNNVKGAVTFSINYYPFTYFNEDTTLTDFEPQQICIKTIQEGPQEILLSESGSGSIKIDGSSYKYCPCSSGDPYFNAPTCNCVNNTIITSATYESSIGIGNPERGGGLPDGILTNGISGTDELVLNFTAPNTFAEICMSFLFSDALGLAKISVNNETHYQSNYSNDTLQTIQEFCIPTTSLGPQTLKFYDAGPGYLRFDGAYLRYCNRQAFPACDAISSLSFNNITSNSVFASWNQVASVKQYFVRFRKNSESAWETVNVANNFIQLGDLQACTDYIIQVGSICNNKRFGNYRTYNFSTLSCGNLCENIITEFSFSNLIGTEQKVSNFIMSNGSVKNGINFKYKAGNFIELRNGFEVKANANFEALIEGCEN